MSFVTVLFLLALFLLWILATDVYLVARACDGKIRSQDLDDAPKLKMILYIGAIPGVPLYNLCRWIFNAGYWVYVRRVGYDVRREAKKITKDASS